MDQVLERTVALQAVNGECTERTRKALEWLVSEKAETIGIKKLLLDAYARTGGPLSIVVTNKRANAYFPASHTLVINPSFVDAAHIRNKDGSSHRSSLESVLGHELTHVGQPGLKEASLKVLALETRLEDEHRKSTYTKAQLAEHEALLAVIESAPTRSAARAAIGRYVDVVILPTSKAIKDKLRAHPDYIEYLEKFENPATEVENKIAKLRGEPLRDGYLDSWSPQTVRRRLIEDMASFYDEKFASSRPYGQTPTIPKKLDCKISR